MNRDELLDRMRAAHSPNDISTAIADARAWFVEYPDDTDVHEAFRELTRMERERWNPWVA
jgi:hypothetical protein